jgi:hypothetical protein
LKRSLTILEKCVELGEAPELAALLEFAKLSGRDGSIGNREALEGLGEPTGEGLSPSSGERPGPSSDEEWDAL